MIVSTIFNCAQIAVGLTLVWQSVWWMGFTGTQGRRGLLMFFVGAGLLIHGVISVSQK